jgi:hypothetical protein
MNIDLFIASEKQELFEMWRGRVTFVGNITGKILVADELHVNILLLFYVFSLSLIPHSLIKITAPYLHMTYCRCRGFYDKI